jgi:hypothetical protein
VLGPKGFDAKKEIHRSGQKKANPDLNNTAERSAQLRKRGPLRTRNRDGIEVIDTSKSKRHVTAPTQER